MAGRVVSASLRFRLLVVLAAAGLLIAGGVRLARMPADVLPETAGPVVEVQTEALGLSAAEVESLITVPQEKNLLDGVMGVTDITSDSVPGLSRIDLHFAPGTDVFRARELVQERLTQAFVLPNVAKPPQLIQPISSSGRTMMIGLTSGQLSLIDLSVLARWTIVPRLLAVPGVANVVTFGQADRQFQVLVDPARLARRGITLTQIIDTAGNSQLVSPLTFLRGNTPGAPGFFEGPNQRITIRDLSPFASPRDLASVPVSGVSGPPVALGGVTTVAEGHQPLIGSALVRGTPGLVLVVQKLPSASTTAVTSGVQRALADLKPGLPGVEVDTSLFRPATYLHEALDDLRTTVIVSTVLGLLALGALLLRLRALLIALVAVTLSLVIAALLLDLLGYTFNALVALGLLIGLAVVVEEGVCDQWRLIDRLRVRSGSRPPDRVIARACAQLRGAAAYAMAIVLLTLAPLFFASGLTARFVHAMVLAFALALIASMLVALTVTPALVALLFPHRPSAEPRHDALPGHIRAMVAQRFRVVYRGWLRRALRLPRGALLAACALGVTGMVALPFMGEPARPSFRDRNLVVRWSGTPGMSLTEMQRITTRASREVAALPSVAAVGADIGRAITGERIVNPDSAELWVAIKPQADYAQAVGAVRSIVQGTPGVSATVSTYEQDSMAGVLASAPDTVTVRLYGQDYGVLGALAQRVRAIVAHTPGISDPRVRLPVEQPTVELSVNPAAAERYGVTPGDVRREAGALVSGITVGNFFEGQKVFDVVIWGVPAVRDGLTALGNLLLDTPAGGHVRLGQVAQVQIRPDPTDIQHQAYSRYLDVTAGLSGSGSGAAQAAFAKHLRAFRFPLEYHAEVLGPPHGGSTSHGAMVGFIVAALVGILLLLQAALRSWSDALVVLALLPVSLVGGLLVALATGELGSLAAAVGLLGVLALAVRQATAIAIPVRDRRPVNGALTAPVVLRAAADQAGATFAGAIVVAVVLLPFVALGNAAGGELLHVAAAVLLGGLVSATPLNLLVVPAALLTLGTRPAAEAIRVSDLRAPSRRKPTRRKAPRARR